MGLLHRRRDNDVAEIEVGGSVQFERSQHTRTMLDVEMGKADQGTQEAATSALVRR